MDRVSGGTCACARCPGREIPTADSESGVNPLNMKKNGVWGRGQGVWVGGGSLIAKHFPEKKRPKEIPLLPWTVASRLFSS